MRQGVRAEKQEQRLLHEGVQETNGRKRAMIDKNKLIGFANDVDREIRDLEEENAELKAELDDWKGNAEGFEPDAYMRLPVDADGEPIRIGDEANVDGVAMTVLGYRLRNDILLGIEEQEGE